MRRSAPGRLETDKNFVTDDDILVEQLRRIYINQQKISDKLDRKNRFLKKLKILCCIN